MTHHFVKQNTPFLNIRVAINCIECIDVCSDCLKLHIVAQPIGFLANAFVFNNMHTKEKDMISIESALLLYACCRHTLVAFGFDER